MGLISAWKILKNIGLLLRLKDEFKMIFRSVVKNKSMPDKKAWIPMLQKLQELFDKKVIDFQDIDESEISEGLKQIEDYLKNEQ